MTGKPALALCILFAGILLLVGADAHAFDSTDVGCERMSTTRFVIMHIAAAVAPFLGGIIISIAHDCNIGGFAYWIVFGPILGGIMFMLSAGAFTLAITAISSIGGGKGK